MSGKSWVDILKASHLFVYSRESVHACLKPDDLQHNLDVELYTIILT